MNKMKSVQPEMKKLQERYADDKQKLQQEIMALYKREGVNPVSGCLPILVQIPVFFALYKVLSVTIEMRQAPFYGWVRDLSMPDPTSIANLFGLLPYTPPEFLHLGALPLIMGATMFLQQRLNPAPTDPVQAKVIAFMPLIFMFTMGSSPVGLVLYWSWTNILSILQQWVIMRRHQT
jgi:YidC/Oxa1 family membrane protein insertase